MNDIVNRIVKLGKSSLLKDQLEAAKLLCQKIFPNGICVNKSAIPKLLPAIIEFMTSKNTYIQKEGCFFVTAVTTTSNGIGRETDNSKFAVEAGAIPNLLKLLSSNDAGVLELSLVCLGNIAHDFPDEVIAEKNDIDLLIKHLDSSSRKICEEALKTVINIVAGNAETSQIILDHGAMKQIKRLLNRTLEIKLLAVKFIKKVSKYFDQIDAIIDENIMPVILKQMNDGIIVHDQMKIDSVKIIRNIINQKPEYFQRLIDQNNVFPKLANNLTSDNIKLINLVEENDGEQDGGDELSTVAETPKSHRKRVQVNQHFTRSKRFKSSPEPTDTDQSVTPNNDDDNGHEHFDDVPTRSPIVFSLPTQIREDHDSSDERDFVLLNIGIFLNECCKTLSLEFDRKKYIEFYRQIKFTQVKSTSKPASHLSTNDNTGFGCLSIFFTGTEKYAGKICDQIKDKYIEDMIELDKENLKKITSSTVTDEHLQTIVKWFKCRILLYCNGGWQRFGEWSVEDDFVPIFVMEKREVGNQRTYKIVLSLKD
uniref:Armadillo repeat-containing protein n=1 Tax=Panagrolaimus sp. ES5 TaxID=591445 RepID=A0AC34GUB0_9BILA